MIKNHTHTAAVLLYLLAAMISCDSPSGPPYPPLRWEQKASFPDGPRSSSAAAAAAGKAYVIFGKKSSGGKGSYQNDCWEYNPQEDAWTKKTSCPGVPRVKAVAAAVDGKIYAGLGYAGALHYNDEAYLKDFWQYDAETDTWQERASAPFKGTGACSAFVYNDEIYVGMGFHNVHFGSQWWKYSPAADSWVQLSDFSGLPRSGGVLCSDNEYIFFGTGYRTENLDDWRLYNPESGSWEKRKKMPGNGRVNAVGLAVHGRFFVSTGRLFRGSLTGGHVKQDILEYDACRDAWYDRGHIPGAGRENAIAFTLNNKGYIGLGESEKELLDDIWCFIP